ncbi:isopenicillin N synthase-like dioxygenase [Ilumatobacter fluminis]|uniref:Isopenicillin N synthase-like dioxygenase n=1 Tax=Ilumatobacter fluminis TaxID=467091 RepID=A0A4R7I4L3_9ACTN|nr:2-oxoglutarate and iron-dependent oxygenase domain-containing protein [Ilumatobacter fluminis]TDT18194.1 isopenicillin N synthase-like dioxygenase [Ilumatobacter fluminis]
MTAEFSDVPVIDLAAEAARLGAGGLGEYLATVYHEVGFAVVTGHGVPTEITDEAFAAARRFFELPLEQKEAVDKRRSRHFRGWEATGVERTNNRPDIREQLDFWTEHPARDVDVEPPYLRLLGPNQWPSDDLAPGFAAAVQRWIYAAAELADRVMGLLSLGLGLDEDHLRRAFGDECMSLCKVINYPPTPAGQFGVNAHHDAGFLTVLATGGTPGLEVQNAAGEWIAVPNVDDGLVINLGEVFQKMTGNYFVATPHRVATPTARRSIAYFHGPSLDMPLVALPLEQRFADAVAASPRHAAAGFMVQPDEVDAGAADMSSPHHPDRYGEQLWNYFARSYPDNVRLHYG